MALPMFFPEETGARRVNRRVLARMMPAPVAMLGKVLAVFLWAAVGAGGARAASFDCKLAKTAQEKAICATPKLSVDDEQMATAYKAQLAAMPEAMRGGVREDQRHFLLALATGCAAQKPQPLENLAACMQPQVEDRIKILRSAVVRKGSVVFVTRSTTLLGKDTDDGTPPEGEEANPGYGTLTVSWPQSLASGPEWAAWNDAVLRATQAMAKPDDAKATTSAWQDSWAADVDATVSAAVEHADARMVSTSISDEFMGHGAAHPGEAFTQFHWLLKERRALVAADVFAPGTAWKRFLTARCRVGLTAQGKANGGDITYGEPYVTKALADQVGEPENWSFDARGLTISFPEYTVAPRVAQPEPVRVLWTALKPYLAAGFAPPQ